MIIQAFMDPRCFLELETFDPTKDKILTGGNSSTSRYQVHHARLLLNQRPVLEVSLDVARAVRRTNTAPIHEPPSVPP